MKKIISRIISVLVFCVCVFLLLMQVYKNCDLSFLQSCFNTSTLEDMQDGVLYFTDFSVMYTSADGNPGGDIDESSLTEEISGGTQSYYLVMEFDMQMANGTNGREYLTVEVTILDASVAGANINYANTSSTSVDTADGQTTVTAIYSIPDKAKKVKSASLIVELIPQEQGTTDISYNFIADDKDVTGYETDSTITVSESGVYLRKTALEYTLSDESYTVTGVGEKSGSIYIPSVYNGISVTAIDSSAFYDKTDITGVSIADGLSYIGSQVFYNTGFYNDESNWKDGLLYIDKYLIEADENVINCTIKDDTIAVASYAFYQCNVRSVVIPDSVISIGNSCFYECSLLASVTLPDSIEKIESSVFYKCTSLSDIEKIESSVFYKCTSLSDIEIPETVTSIGADAFYACSSLTSVTIPRNVTAIGAEAFSSCIRLKTATFENTEGWRYATFSVSYGASIKWTYHSLDVTDSSVNAKYLRSTYASYS